MVYIATTSLTFVHPGLFLSIFCLLYEVQVENSIWYILSTGPLSNVGLDAACLQPVFCCQDIFMA